MGSQSLLRRWGRAARAPLRVLLERRRKVRVVVDAHHHPRPIRELATMKKRLLLTTISHKHTNGSRSSAHSLSVAAPSRIQAHFCSRSSHSKFCTWNSTGLPERK